MAPRFLWIARELTMGGTAYLALRHLQRMPQAHVDLLVTGPVAPGMRARLPSHVTVHPVGWADSFTSLGVLDLREAILDDGHPCLQH